MELVASEFGITLEKNVEKTVESAEAAEETKETPEPVKEAEEPEAPLSLLTQAASRLRHRTTARRIAKAFFIENLSFPLFKRAF